MGYSKIFQHFTHKRKINCVTYAFPPIPSNTLSTRDRWSDSIFCVEAKQSCELIFGNYKFTTTPLVPSCSVIRMYLEIIFLYWNFVKVYSTYKNTDVTWSLRSSATVTFCPIKKLLHERVSCMKEMCGSFVSFKLKKYQTKIIRSHGKKKYIENRDYPTYIYIWGLPIFYWKMNDTWAIHKMNIEK